MKTKLPDGIEAADLKYPGYEDQQGVPYEERQFEMWFAASFGWCITTLDIGGRRGQATRRTYAVRISDGNVVRIGAGPHVTETVTVYVTKKSQKRLARFIELRTKGMGQAGQIRDRISSRRAQGQVMRAEGRHSWRWDV